MVYTWPASDGTVAELLRLPLRPLLITAYTVAAESLAAINYFLQIYLFAYVSPLGKDFDTGGHNVLYKFLDVNEVSSVR